MPFSPPNGNTFKVLTGLRTSVSFSLHWHDVDLAGKHLLVHRAIVRGVEKLNTKTSTARQVILNGRALAAIQRQRADTQTLRHADAQTRRRATRMSGSTCATTRLGLTTRFPAQLLGANAATPGPALPPYNTRHTYTTMMLMAGMTPAFCGKQLGHSVEMFLHTCAKWIDGGHNALEMGRLEAALAPDLSLIYPKKGR